MDNVPQQDRSVAIATLNDQFRKTFVGGSVFLTAGVQALASDVKAMALRKVATYSEFTPDNDPHGEHDFGAFDLAGRRFFWKIDYYDPSLEFGSAEPSDPKITRRVLTVMLAEEY